MAEKQFPGNMYAMQFPQNCAASTEGPICENTNEKTFPWMNYNSTVATHMSGIGKPPQFPITSKNIPNSHEPNMINKRSHHQTPHLPQPSLPPIAPNEASMDKPFQCDLCPRQFARRETLISHRRTHTGEKPFVCDVCSKQFARRDTLQSHYRTHSGDKPFRCDLCGEQFARRDTLQSHRRIHTGEKPFQCDVCQRQFAQRDALQCHKDRKSVV